MYFRKVIRIRAEDSPNIALAFAQKSHSQIPTGTEVLPGLLSWELYQHRLATWDKVRICVGIHGQFYEGAEVLLYPPDWLNAAEQRADQLKGTHRQAAAIGCDTAEGGDDTCWAVIDELGLIKLISYKTPNTAVITARTIALMKEFSVKPEYVMFDQGGGGQQHADRLKQQGYPVQTVSFGESVIADPTRFIKVWDQRQDERREKYAYINRRAQMYWILHLRMDPSANEHVFAIPAEYTELRRQLAPMPLWYDQEGRIMLPPKRRRSGVDSKLKTIEDILGCSPDQADALVLATYALEPGARPVVLRPLF